MTPEEVLLGLPPNLIIDLAQLAPSGPTDLTVTVQLLSFGDRAVLLAYGAIEYGRRRTVKVLPFFHELADEALLQVCTWARSTGFGGPGGSRTHNQPD